MVPPRIRPALDAIQTYSPGRPPERRDGAPAFKLSSNENPYPPLPGVLEVAAASAATMNRYPDMRLSALYAQLSGRLDVPAGDLAAGTGSVAVLYHLMQALCEPGDEVVYAWRSFEAYPIAVQVTGATSVRVALGPGARHDLDAMLAAITDRTRVVIVCTPNNPTGPAVRGRELREFVQQVPDDVLVVVDEAYHEFVRTEDRADGVDLYRGRPNVCVLRTFSKAYGLAGFRVGYAVAPSTVAEAVRKCALPFGVSQVAQDAAIASLDAQDALFERVDALVAERTRVRDALCAQGWDVPSADGNFVWLSLGADSVEFAAQCQAGGVAVRPFGGDGVRITIGEKVGNDIVLEMAAKWLRARN